MQQQVPGFLLMQDSRFERPDFSRAENATTGSGL
jgi:hypothetical protein